MGWLKSRWLAKCDFSFISGIGSFSCLLRVFPCFRTIFVKTFWYFVRNYVSGDCSKWSQFVDFFWTIVSFVLPTMCTPVEEIICVKSETGGFFLDSMVKVCFYAVLVLFYCGVLVSMWHLNFLLQFDIVVALLRFLFEL